jgi:hypothetical protein
MNTAYDFMKKKAVLGIAALLVVVAVLVIIFAGGKKDLADRSEPVAEVNETDSLVMEPVVEEDYTYTFEGIQWDFPVEEEGTRVNFMLENFSRIEGAYVTFGNPYKLGFYDGECSEVESMEFDAEENPGIPLAFAECVSPSATQQFALFQQGEEVVAKLRRHYKEIEGDKDPNFVTIYTVNLTEIIPG